MPLNKIYFSYCLIVISSFLSATNLPSPYTQLQPIAVDKIPLEHQNYKSIPFKINELSGVNRQSYPVRGGIPLIEGEVYNINQINLSDLNGKHIPCQFKVLSRWWKLSEKRKKDGNYSIKWLLLDFQTDIKANEELSFLLNYGSGVSSKPTKGIQVIQNKKEITIDTGAIKAQFISETGLKQIFLGKDKKPLLRQPVHVYADLEYKRGGEDKWITLKPLDQKKFWKFRPDPKDIGVQEEWFKRSIKEKKWTNQHPSEAWEDYQKLNFTDGYGWYRAKFKIKNSWSKRKLYLKLSDVYTNYRSKNFKLWFYLNGKLIETFDKKGASKSRRNKNWITLGSLTADEEHTIAIRVFDGGAVGGLLCRPLLGCQRNQQDPYPIESGFINSLNDKNTEVSLVSEGPERSVVRVQGVLKNKKGQAASNYKTLFTFYKNKAAIDLSYTFINLDNPLNFSYYDMGVKIPLIQGDSPQVVFENNGAVAEPIKKKDSFELFQFHNGPKRYPGYPHMLDNPFIPVYQLISGKFILAEGGKSSGWLAWSDQQKTCQVIAKDFWKSYPSGLTINGQDQSIVLHMWPKQAGKMDLRNWDLREEQRWDEVDTKAINGDKIAQQIRAVFVNEGAYKGFSDYTRSNRVGAMWTRDFRLKFFKELPKEEKLLSATKIFHQPLRPYVSSKYNCRTKAVGLSMHPFDRKNYPEIEAALNSYLTWLRKVQQDWYQIYGMWYHGAIRYHTSENRQDTYKRKYWARRWLNQESAHDIAKYPFLQYIRTNHIPYFDYAETLANYSMNIIVTQYHPMRQAIGHGRVHYAEPWGSQVFNNHTDFEGVLLYYYLTGNERAAEFLQNMEDRFRNYNIEKMTFMGRQRVRRDEEVPFRNITSLWFLNGEEDFRQQVFKCIKHFNNYYDKGLVGRGGASYRTKMFWRAYQYTQSEDIRKLIEPNVETPPLGYKEEFLGKDSPKMIMRDYLEATYRAFVDKRYGGGSWVLNDPLLPFDEIDRVTEMKNHRTYYLSGKVRYAYPGALLYHHYRHQLPILENKTSKYPHVLRHYYYGFKTEKIKTKHQIKTLDLGKFVNSDPFKTREPKQNYRPTCLWYAYDDEREKVDTKVKSKEIALDFGPLSAIQKKWKPVSDHAIYPSLEGFELDYNFSGYPFGAEVKYLGIPFKLLNPATYGGKGMLVLKKGESYKIPVGNKIKKVFFLGQVSLKSFNLGSKKAGARYHIHYQDGSKDTHDILPGIHYDSWESKYVEATHVTPIQRFSNYDGTKTQSVHINLLEFKTKRKKTVKSITLEGLSNEDIAILAISVETDQTKEERFKNTSIIETAQELKIGEPISFSAKKGWHQVKIKFGDWSIRNDFRHKKRSPQLYIAAQNKLAVGGFLAHLGTTLSFPVKSTGTIELKILGNEIPKNLKPIVQKIQIIALKNKPNWMKKRKSLKDFRIYGWKKGGRGLTSHGVSDYLKSSNAMRDFINVVGRVYTEHIPNGKYELNAYMFSPGNQPGFRFKVNGRSSRSVDLPAQEHEFPFPRCRSYENVNAKFEVKDGKMVIRFPTSKDREDAYRQYIGLRGLKLKRR